jgi:hypothetical protein
LNTHTYTQQTYTHTHTHTHTQKKKKKKKNTQQTHRTEKREREKKRERRIRKNRRRRRKKKDRPTQRREKEEHLANLINNAKDLAAWLVEGGEEVILDTSLDEHRGREDTAALAHHVGDLRDVDAHDGAHSEEVGEEADHVLRDVHAPVQHQRVRVLHVGGGELHQQFLGAGQAEQPLEGAVPPLEGAAPRHARQGST